MFPPVVHAELLRAARKVLAPVARTASSTSNPTGDPSVAYGFQRDLVRLVANLVNRNPALQAQAVALDAMPILLDHCSIDERNPCTSSPGPASRKGSRSCAHLPNPPLRLNAAVAPVIREWAIVALRNLCENNPSAQEVVAALTPQGTAAIPELERAGAQIELDEHGRPRVRPPAHPE